MSHLQICTWSAETGCKLTKRYTPTAPKDKKMMFDIRKTFVSEFYFVQIFMFSLKKKKYVFVYLKLLNFQIISKNVLNNLPNATVVPYKKSRFIIKSPPSISKISNFHLKRFKFWNNVETRFENFCVPANAISFFENPHFLSHRPPSNLGREAFFL